MQYLLLGIFFIFPLMSISQPTNHKNSFKTPSELDLEIPQTVIGSLRNPDEIAQLRAIKNLTPSQLKNPIVRQEIVKALKSSNEIIQQAAVQALQLSRSDKPIIIKNLIKSLSSTNEIILLETVIALRDIQSNDPTVHQQLVLLLSHKNSIIRQETAMTLRALQSKELFVHKALISTLDDPNESVRLAVLLALESSDLTTLDLVKIANMLHDPNVAIRTQVITILEKIRLPANSVIHEFITDGIFDSNPYIRLVTVRILEKNISAARAADKSLHKESVIEQGLKMALNSLDPKAQAIAQKALDTLSQKNTACRTTLSK